jgi:uncharacterized protein (TIGR01244 family)
MLTPSATSLRALLALTLLTLAVAPATAQEEPTLPVMMSAEWAVLACEAWNENETLTTELATWGANDGDRGFKILRLYRTDCEDSPWVELQITLEESQALCTYGGALGSDELIGDVDYVMHATTQRWLELGAGKYGPMKAMMFGRLKFDGPMWEAMKNMGPFGGFLRLVGAVEADDASCPVEAPQVADEDLLPNPRRPLPDVLSGGQPTLEGLGLAQAEGYKTVINLRTESEPGTGRDDVEALGMTYVALPIGSDGLTKENAVAFAEILETAERPAILHCGSGNRIGAMFALKALHVDGEDAETALEIGLAAGLTQLEGAVRTELGLPAEIGTSED